MERLATLKEQSKFSLMIDEECLGSWMPICNSFALRDAQYRSYQSYWSGIIFQLGRFDRPGSILDGIKIYTKTGMRSFGSKMCEKGLWINAVAHETQDKGAKRYERNQKTGIEKRASPVTLDKLAPYISRPGNWPVPTLHPGLRPYPGAITLWPRETFTMSSERGTHRGHRDYEFLCEKTNAFRVEVYKYNGTRFERSKKELKDVYRIRVKAMRGHTKDAVNEHGDHDDPPQFVLTSTGSGTPPSGSSVTPNPTGP